VLDEVSAGFGDGFITEAAHEVFEHVAPCRRPQRRAHVPCVDAGRGAGVDGMGERVSRHPERTRHAARVRRVAGGN